MKGNETPEHTVLTADSVAVKAATPIVDEVGL